MLFALSLFGILRLHGERLKNGIVNCDKLHYLIVKTFHECKKSHVMYA